MKSKNKGREPHPNVNSKKPLGSAEYSFKIKWNENKNIIYHFGPVELKSAN